MLSNISHLSTRQLMLLLLLTLFLGGLGSFSVVPYLLPSGLQPAPTPATISLASMPTPTATPANAPFLESECTATPQSMKYLQTGQGQPLPDTWVQAGSTQKDFANVQACAATFVQLYNTFVASNPHSFEAGTYMFTDGAKGRFYGSPPNSQPDQHMDPMWRALLQKQHYQQSAQVATPNLLAVSRVSGKLLAWMVVPYRITEQNENGQPMAVHDGQGTVLLVSAPVNIQGTGTGWQVSQWVMGKGTQFNPLPPL